MSVAMATMFAMLIQTVTTQMVLIFVHARKDTLEMDSHVKVNKSSLHYLKQPRPRISIQLRMSSYAQIHNLRWSKIQARIFYELISIFPSPEGTRIKEGNEQDFFQYYMINNRIRDLSFHYYQEYFSRICGHARITPPPPYSPLTFLNSIDTRKICFYCYTFFVTFQPLTTAQSEEQNNLFSIPNFSIFMCLQSSFMYYVLF